MVGHPSRIWCSTTLQSDAKRYDRMHLSTGTIVKLFDYQVGSKFLTFRGTREAWSSDLTESDGGAISDLGEGVVYKINYDNVYHLKYRLSQRGEVSPEVVTEKYILGMRILLLGYQHAFNSIQKSTGTDGNGISEYADEFRRAAARASASTVLALAENLPKIVDASSKLSAQCRPQELLPFLQGDYIGDADREAGHQEGCLVHALRAVDVSIHQLANAAVELVKVVVGWIRVDPQRDPDGLAKQFVVIANSIIRNRHAHAGDHAAS
jgi:hypothetical protein